MAFRLYLVPISTAVDGTRFPKYFLDKTIANSTWAMIDYGIEPWALVCGDLSPTDDATIVGKADAFGLPTDLSPVLTAGQVTAIQNKLEAINLPADWVSTSLTWVQVVRIVCGIMGLLQRYMFYAGATSLFTGSVTLTTTIGALPLNARTNLLNAATDLNLDVSSITGSTTIRQALGIVGQQFAAIPLRLAGQTI